MSKSLEALEKLTKGKASNSDTTLIKRELKALEILKKKFYFNWLFSSKNVEQFNEGRDYDNSLTEEEYELVKEVLKCQK